MATSVTSESARAEEEAPLSTAQRARAERHRLRARLLREARRAAHPNVCPAPATASASSAAARDTGGGGGFLAEEGAAGSAVRLAPPPSAPVADPRARPPCERCGAPVAHSYLLDTFAHPACDACRDDAGAHALLTRTEAKAEFLLRDCDLDARQPPLRCVTRPNPHAARGHMRLYLRAQVERRALLVWGSEEALEAEAARRAERRAGAAARRGERALRALRLAVRSSLFAGARAEHEHAWGAETYDAAADLYSRACACGHTETYEKM